MHIVLLLIPWLLVLIWSAFGVTSFGEQAVPPPVVANEPTQGAIDECVNREMESQRIPGLSLAVVRAGKLLQAKGYGKASLELDAPATASTLYGLGSISKQFTATAIMLLVEAGKLNLDDMVKWDSALNSERLLKKASLNEMWSPVRLNDGTTYNYGFGWYLRPVPSHRTVAHGGGLPGFSTFIWRFIDDELTIIVLSNCETADAGRIGLAVAGLYAPALLSPEVKKQL